MITGASSGIGRASALALAGEGANLVLTARRKTRLEELSTQVEKLGGNAVFVVGDAREEELAKKVVDTTVKTFGSLDIMLNNVGVGIYQNLVDSSVEDYDEMMDTNMRTTFLFSRYAVPVMIEQGSGILLMISSMAGAYGFGGQATYCATKFAQVGFAQSLDHELRPHGIKVGVICPGGVKTEFAFGKGRTEESVAQSGMLEAEDVASAVLLACTQSKNSRIIEVRMRTMNERIF